MTMNPFSRLILVTGANGFVGRALVRALAAQGFRVRAALRRDGLVDGASEHVVVGDLRGEVDWRAALDGVNAIVHCAGLAHARAHADDDYDAINHRAVGHLALAAREAGIADLVLISSVRAVCGQSCDALVTEATSPAPDSAYGRSKLAGEDAVRAILPQAVILRPVAIHGPGERGNMALLRRVARLPLPLAGIAARRSYLAVETLAELVAFALTSPAMRGQTVLAADEPPLTPAQLVDRLSGGRAMLFRDPTGWVGRLLRRFAPVLVMPMVVSTQRLRDLGFRPGENASS